MSDAKKCPPADKPDVAALLKECNNECGCDHCDCCAPPADSPPCVFCMSYHAAIRRLARAVEDATIERAAHLFEGDIDGKAFAGIIRAMPRLTEEPDEQS